MDGFAMGASTYLDFKTNFVLAGTETLIIMNEKGEYRGPKESEKLRKKIVANYKEIDAKTSRNKIDTIFDAQYSKNTGNDQPRLLADDYDETVEIEKLRTFLYLGDEFGQMKLWDLTRLMEIIEESGVNSCRYTY
jgi:hypothetical protein